MSGRVAQRFHWPSFMGTSPRPSTRGASGGLSAALHFDSYPWWRLQMPRRLRVPAVVRMAQGSVLGGVQIVTLITAMGTGALAAVRTTSGMCCWMRLTQVLGVLL